jgi:hypothetical protein
VWAWSAGVAVTTAGRGTKEGMTNDEIPNDERLVVPMLVVMTDGIGGTFCHSCFGFLSSLGISSFVILLITYYALRPIHKLLMPQLQHQ